MIGEMTAGDDRDRKTDTAAVEKRAGQESGRPRTATMIVIIIGPVKIGDLDQEKMRESVITVGVAGDRRQVPVLGDTHRQEVSLRHHRSTQQCITDLSAHRHSATERSTTTSSALPIPIPIPIQIPLPEEKWHKYAYSNTLASKSSTFRPQ